MERARERVRVAKASRIAPAKINLALHVTGRRADGYHSLSSLVAFAADGDRVTVEEAHEDGFSLSGPFAAALEGLAPEGNIVLRALHLARGLAAADGAGFGPLAITLDKRLPVAAGLGGGSADAAALLRLLGKACPPIAARLREACSGLGADVPMCLDGRPAQVEGIGDIGTPLPAFPAAPCLLVNPGIPVSTPAVFRALTRTDGPPLAPTPALATLGGLLDYLRDTRNDLAPAAMTLAPAIGTARDLLMRHGAAFARMSGSGATVFGLFETAEATAAAAVAVAAAHPGWWVLPTRLMPAGDAGA